MPGRTLRWRGVVVAQVWECGDLVVDEGSQSVSRAGSHVALTTTEFEMLGLLIRNRTRVVPKGNSLAACGHTTPTTTWSRFT